MQVPSLLDPSAFCAAGDERASFSGCTEAGPGEEDSCEA